MLGHIVKYKTVHNLFYRRVFGVVSVDYSDKQYGGVWILKTRRGKTVYIPAEGTVIFFGAAVKLEG